tara:strand:- start:5 stop:265 length:261 start_codon:yes stop_codon:yes gene_type:complete
MKEPLEITDLSHSGIDLAIKTQRKNTAGRKYIFQLKFNCDPNANREIPKTTFINTALKMVVCKPNKGIKTNPARKEPTIVPNVLKA